MSGCSGAETIPSLTSSKILCQGMSKPVCLFNQMINCNLYVVCSEHKADNSYKNYRDNSYTLDKYHLDCFIDFLSEYLTKVKLAFVSDLVSSISNPTPYFIHCHFF